MQPTNAAERRSLEQKLKYHDSYVILDEIICGSSAEVNVENLKPVIEKNVIEKKWLNSETINAYVLMVEFAAKQAGRNVTSFTSYLATKLETADLEENVSWEV